MSAFPIIAQSGQLIMTQASPVAGITPTGNNYKTGLVVIVSSVSEGYKVGNTVLYDTTGATYFRYNSNNYILINENKVIYKYL